MYSKKDERGKTGGRYFAQMKNEPFSKKTKKKMKKTKKNR